MEKLAIAIAHDYISTNIALWLRYAAVDSKTIDTNFYNA